MILMINIDMPVRPMLSGGMAGGDVDELALVEDLASELGVAGRPAVRRVAWDSRGVRISGLRWGTEEPVLVLLHGGSLNAHSWDAMLLLHEIPALALDLPGHGRSSWFEEPLYVPEALAAAVAPAIAALAPRARAVAGHSLGGLSALALAARRPELVQRLVLVDATPGSTPDRSQDILEFVAESEFESFDAFLEHAAAYRPSRSRSALRRSLLHNTRRREDGAWTWRHDGRDHPTRDRWAVMFEELPKGWQHARAVGCPTLLVRGGRSRIVTDDDVAYYRRTVTDLRVEVIAGAGHNIHGEQPKALGAIIAAFLEEGGR
jgi:pimeloyl-ACP methyl ester carboxylesterase